MFFAFTVVYTYMCIYIYWYVCMYGHYIHVTKNYLPLSILVYDSHSSSLFPRYVGVKYLMMVHIICYHTCAYRTIYIYSCLQVDHAQKYRIYLFHDD